MSIKFTRVGKEYTRLDKEHNWVTMNFYDTMAKSHYAKIVWDEMIDKYKRYGFVSSRTLASKEKEYLIARENMQFWSMLCAQKDFERIDENHLLDKLRD